MIYVAIELADERYCDGCPCLQGAVGVRGSPPEPIYGSPRCDLFGIAWAAVEGADTDWHMARPPACIDASAEIEDKVEGDYTDWGKEYDVVAGKGEASLDHAPSRDATEAD